MEDIYATIDLKAFYASIECVERGLDIFTTPLVVCDPERGSNTIVLSVTPYLKKMGVPSRCRKKELPNIPGLIMAVPRMKKYVEISSKIVGIFLDFIGEDDLHVYSIDESFLHISPYLKLYKCDAYSLVKKILNRIKKETGLVATAGIGKNILLSKIACDVEGKNKLPDYIAYWKDEDIENKLWKITPLSKMWGISNGYETKLNKMGIYSIGDLAKQEKKVLIKTFGIMGEELWNHANGIDYANIREKYTPQSTSLSVGQQLMRDYKADEVPLIIREMTDDLCFRLRERKAVCDVIFLGVNYSMKYNNGFGGQMKLNMPTADNDVIYQALINIFKKGVDRRIPIRGVHIGCGDLSDENLEQLSLFEDVSNTDEKKSFLSALDEIQIKYGKNSVLRTTSLLEGSTAKERHNQIGGHRK